MRIKGTSREGDTLQCSLCSVSHDASLSGLRKTHQFMRPFCSFVNANQLAQEIGGVCGSGQGSKVHWNLSRDYS